MPPASASETVTISLIRSVSGAPFFIGRDSGFFASEGVTLDLRFFESSTAVTTAVASGDADFGATAFTAGFYNLAGKGAIKVVGATARSEPGIPVSAYVASRQAHAAGFVSLRDLPGKAFGATTVGGPASYAVGLVARKYGFDFAAVRMVPLQSLPNVLAALKSGQVDVTMVQSNLGVAVQDRGDGIIIGWDDEVPYQLSGFFTSTRNVRERRTMVERFVRGYQKGAQLYHDTFLQRDAQGRMVKGGEFDRLIAIIAGNTGQKPEQIAASLTFIDPAGRLKVKDLYDQIAFWQSLGQVDAGVKAAEVMDLSFVDGHFDVPTH